MQIKASRQTDPAPSKRIAALAIVLLLTPTAAPAQAHTFYGADGRITGRSTTDSGGSTTFYGASFEGVFLPYMIAPDGRPLLEHVSDLLPKPDEKVVQMQIPHNPSRTGHH